MTAVQTSIVIKLLTGYCLVKHYTFKRKVCYRLIDHNSVTVDMLQCRSVDKLNRYTKPRQKLFKRDKFGRLTLNLSVVRQLHGNCTIKQLYYKREELLQEAKENAGKKLSKPRKKKPMPPAQDVPTLF